MNSTKEERAEWLRDYEKEKRTLDLAKKGLVTGDAVGLYEFIGDGPRPTADLDLHTSDCRCERLRLPKYALKGDLIEVSEGDRVPSPKLFRKLLPKEVEEVTK